MRTKHIRTIISNPFLISLFLISGAISQFKASAEDSFRHYKGSKQMPARKILPSPQTLPANSMLSSTIDGNRVQLLLKSADGTILKQTNWQWLNPLPQGNALWDIQSFDNDNAVAIGGGGTFIKTRNGGKTWSVFEVFDQPYNFNNIEFTDISHGMAIDLGGSVFKTIDGGNSWKKVLNDSSGFLRYMDFVDAMHGTIVGDKGTIFRSDDGGETWIRQYCPDKRYNLVGVEFIDPEIGFIIGHSSVSSVNAVLKTADGGHNWIQQLADSNATFQALHFLDKKLGLIIGNGVHYTNNGGAIWRKTNTSISGGYAINDFAFSPAKEVFAVGNMGSIIKSVDWGQSWAPVSSGISTAALHNICFSDSVHGFIVGEAGVILRTENGGQSWSKQTEGTEFSLRSVAFLDDHSAVAVGHSGVMLKTINGGKDWQALHSPTKEFLSAIDFYDPLNGICVGAHGTILRTADGGINWSIVPSSSYSDLEAVHYADPRIVIAVGMNGTILRSTDGGFKWSPQTALINNWFFDVDFFSPAQGFIVGDAGIILKTTNGGMSWEITRHGEFAGERLLAMQMSSPLRGIAAGYSSSSGEINRSLLLGTRDGGNTWFRLTTDLKILLEDLCFIDEMNGVAAGHMGGMIQTIDGGNTWVPVTLTTTNDIYSLVFHRTARGWFGLAVGDHGTIMLSAISPLDLVQWTWSGSVDFSWNNPLNWNPPLLPTPKDSVVIPATSRNPLIDAQQQQLAIASLSILPGAELRITKELERLVILGNVSIGGILILPDDAYTSVVVGGNWKLTVPASQYGLSSVGRGKFYPGKSTIYFSGNSQVEGEFYNLVLEEDAAIQSTDNITVTGILTNHSALTLQILDTLFIANSAPAGIQGVGIINGGTVRRQIISGSTDYYYFESDRSWIRFAPDSKIPQAIDMTSFPNTFAPDTQAKWVEIQSSIDTQRKMITADTITGFSRWKIRVPTLKKKTKQEDHNGWNDVKRYYIIRGYGGGSFKASLALRYDVAELPPGCDENALKLFREIDLTQVYDESSEPSVFQLFQNFPNPFNSSTTISYYLPEKGHVRLAVYNMVGQIVAALLDREQEAGKHSIPWNTTVSSGIYFYKCDITSADGAKKYFSEVKKLLVIR